MKLKSIVSLSVIVILSVFASTGSLAEETANFAPLRINVGGGAIQWNGAEWMADSQFRSGQALEDSTATPSGVQQGYVGSVYASQRWDYGAVEYAIPVPPGSYDLELHFAELWHPEGSVGRRVFDVEVEGIRIAEALDVVARANGGIDTPVVIIAEAVDPGTFGAPGLLEVRISTRNDASILNALVVACAEGATCAAVSGAAEYGPEEEAGPILSAVNLAGRAMDYDGIVFAADDGIATGRTGEEGAGGNDGPNGTQTDLIGTPFASVRWGPEVSYTVAAPSGTSTLDLFFMEGWWPDAGRRVMAIEIEGQRVREGFDIVEASGGDFNMPQILRFTGIDPATSGDPNSIELRVIAQRDNAVLSAVVLRCEDTAEACAAKVAEAEADKAEAAAAAPQIVDYGENLNVISGGNVEVRLTNLDPSESYWVTLVPEDLPVGRWADYEEASGLTETRLRFAAPANAGRMEVRLHAYGQGDDPLLSRRSVVVLMAQQAATVAPEAMEAERMRWQGFWRWTGSREAALGGETASVISTDEGVHLLFNLSWARCEAAFEPGARPELMTPVGFTCPFSPDRVITDIALAEGPDGAIRVNMQLNGQPHHFNIPKEIALPVSASVVPAGFPFETAGITLEPTFAAQRAAIEARLEGQGLSADWTSTKIADDLYLHYSNEPEDFFRYVGEHYQVFVLGTGDDAIPIGLIRRWMPAADAQPLHETLVTALQNRYGPESFAQIYDRGFGERYLLGSNWAFDRQGNRLSEPCSGPVAYTHALRYLPGQNYGRLGQIPTYASWVFGCGIHLQVTHSVPRPGQPLQAMQAVLIDSSRIEQSDWARYAAQVPWRIESVRADAAEEAAEQREAEGIQPDL